MNKELITDMWQEAKKVLPGYMYAVLYQANSQPTFSDVPNFFEKIALRNANKIDLKKISDKELNNYWYQFCGWFSNIDKGENGYDDFVDLGKLFVHEFKCRGLAIESYGIDFINKELSSKSDDLYTFSDIVNWVGEEVCKIEYNKSTFTDINSKEKLQYALYMALAKKAPSVKMYTIRKSTRIYQFDYGVEVDAKSPHILKSFFKTKDPDKKYKIKPGYVADSTNIDKMEFKNCELATTDTKISDTLQNFLNNYRCVQRLKKEVDLLPYFGSPRSKVVFVGLSPDLIELNSEQFFVSKIQKIFKEKYLKPLSLSIHDVLLGNLVPVPVFDASGKRRRPIQKEIDAWKFFFEQNVTSDMCVIARTC
jgi:hypothetical protein